MESAAALAWIPPSPAGRKLNDHAGALLCNSRLDSSEALGIGRGRLIVVAHVDMDERGSDLIGLARRYDLLGRRDRHRRVVFLARNRSSDRDGYDNRFHALPPSSKIYT